MRRAVGGDGDIEQVFSQCDEFSKYTPMCKSYVNKREKINAIIIIM